MNGARRRLVIWIVFGAWLCLAWPAQPVRGATSTTAVGQVEEIHLSPYWQPTITQWEAFILRHARNENLDPDLIAAIIMAESQGDTDTLSSSGAVGLMQVMPSETGFAERPSAEELTDPDVNLAFGARLLTQILEEARGDLFTALTAYHGGWRQLNPPRSWDYALEVISLYAEAIAVRNAYDASSLNSWGLVVEIQGRDDADLALAPAPGWLITSHLSRPRPSAAQDVIGAVVYTDADEFGHPWRITLWLLSNRAAPSSHADHDILTALEIGRLGKVSEAIDE